jgi:aminopeptidase N
MMYQPKTMLRTIFTILLVLVAIAACDTPLRRRTVSHPFEIAWDDRWDRVDRADIPIGLPVGAYVDQEYGAIVYGRGPLFVAALAEEMGQKEFDEFLRDYYQSHKWGIGTSDAFKQLAERHCQCDLTALFEEWVYGK